MSQFEHLYQNFLDNFPYPRSLKNIRGEAPYLYYQGKRFIDFSSNDYLHLANHPLLIERSNEFSSRYGAGSSSSRLVRGNHELFDVLEKKLAKALGKESALILASGYQANVSVLEALLDEKILGMRALVFCDKYAHASMQVSAHHSAQLIRFKHNDLDHLQQLLEKNSEHPASKFILVESLYSMDGDLADMQRLTALAKKYRAFLYVDEAHAVGVYGNSGWGCAVDYAQDVDVIMGTFSKALGGFGAYIACSKKIKNYLIHKCRGLIYSTALPPAVLGTISAAIELVPTLDQERKKLFNHAERVRKYFLSRDVNIGTSISYIIPWIIGNAEHTRKMSCYLEEKGIFAGAIQPPTVPVQQSRIRFCLSAGHTGKDVEQLLRIVD